MADVSDLLAAYDTEMRAPQRVPPAGVTYERDGPLIRIVGSHRGLIRPQQPDLGLTGADLDSLIHRQRDHFAARGQAVEWKVRGHDQPDDLPDRLRAAGFRPEHPSTVMIGHAADLAGQPELPDGAVLRETRDAADMHRIAAMQSRVWNQDAAWIADDLNARMAAAPDDTTVMVVEAGNEVVSAAWLAYHTGTRFGALLGGATLPDWQGRGLYRALLTARARQAVTRGVELLQVDASPDSEPILRRFGFHAVTTTTPYVWTP